MDPAARSNSPTPSHREHQSPPLDLDSKRQRVSRACDRCRRKKTKCDARRPTCSHCHAISASCTYLDAAKKRGPPKGYIEVIENRLHKVEELLRGLVTSDSAAARHVLEALSAPGSDGLAVVTDPSGMLFGGVTLSELESCAAQSPVPTQANSSNGHLSANHRHATTAAASISISSLTSETAAPNAPPAHRRSSDLAENDCAEHLTRLERGVGHLTLDPTGSLRYLGDSSGWDMVNRNLISSAASPRLTKGVNGAFRWPPISSIPMRDTEEDVEESATDHAPGVEPVVIAQSTDQHANSGRHIPSRFHVISRVQGTDAATAASGLGTSNSPAKSFDQDRAVPVPRNMPPSGKPPMPDADEEARLLALYFRYVHPVFPILYKSYFLERVLAKNNRPSPSLLSAVFAAASTYKFRESQSEADLTRARIQMAVHFQRAKLYLDEQYTFNTTASILTLLLMAVYEQGTMSTRSWLYSGMAIRKAYDLGLHRDVGVTNHQGHSVLSQTEVQVRQRAWWGCYILDIMVSATLGRPTTIRDFTFDVPFPASYGEDNDDLLVESSMSASQKATSPVTSASVRTGSTKGVRQHPCQPPTSSSNQRSLLGRSMPALAKDARTSIAVAERMVDYVALAVGESESDELDNKASDELGERRPQERKLLGVYYLGLLHILSHILTEMYTCKPSRAYVAKFCVHDLHSRVERLIVLDHELRQWKASLPPCLLYPVDDILAIKPARCVYISLIHLVYYTAMILLHRPFISRLGEPPLQATSPLSAESNSFAARRHSSDSPLPSHSICTVSAQMISLIGQAIVQDSRVFIMPFITFMTFTAGTMHLNNVIVGADSQIARRFLKRTLDVMSRLGAHWQVSSKCHNMLSALVRANGIELDQAVGEDGCDCESEASSKAIRDRCRETSCTAYAVYESRAMYRERNISTPKLSSSHSTTALRSCQGAQRLVGSSDSATISSGKAKARARGWSIGGQDSLLPDSTYTTSQQLTLTAPPAARNAWLFDPRPEDQMNQKEQTWGTASVAWSGSASARQVSVLADEFRLTRPPHSERSTCVPKTVARQMFALRNKIDSDGMPIVPASPYTSVDFSREAISSVRLMQNHLPLEHQDNSHVAFTQMQAPARDEAAPTLGQFVPSLEFFANADYPLGLGGPNGQASLDLPLAMASRSGANPSCLQAQAHPSAMSASSTLASMPESTSQAFAAYSASSVTHPGNIADSYGSSGGMTDIFAASLFGAADSATSAFSASALSTVGGLGSSNASANFGRMLVDSDMAQKLPIAGIASNASGLGGLTGLDPLAWCPGEASVAPSVPQAAETPWKDYVSQVIRMFNADHCMPDTNMQ
ncbi:hypothetical protein IWW37_001568 [Coemansia sp. RSA 2050]|nr:hypothetical protein IWW37_001568 [Coemansia sp. RSA 2050]KAJ2736953.1 hypothetical protein IW152_000464 [Coemansia sp. BCRC 34962]